MPDVRKTIINNLVTQMETITTANSYNTDQYDVTRDVEHIDSLPTRLVSWSVLDGPDVPVAYSAGNVVVVRMEIAIRIQVPSAGLEQDKVPADSFNDALTDLRQLVAAASFMTALGANARFVAIGAMDGVTFSPRRAIATVPLSISYWYDGDAP